MITRNSISEAWEKADLTAMTNHVNGLRAELEHWNDSIEELLRITPDYMQSQFKVTGNPFWDDYTTMSDNFKHVKQLLNTAEYYKAKLEEFRLNGSLRII